MSRAYLLVVCLVVAPFARLGLACGGGIEAPPRQPSLDSGIDASDGGPAEARDAQIDTQVDARPTCTPVSRFTSRVQARLSTLGGGVASGLKTGFVSLPGGGCGRSGYARVFSLDILPNGSLEGGGLVCARPWWANDVEDWTTLALAYSVPLARVSMVIQRRSGGRLAVLRTDEAIWKSDPLTGASPAGAYPGFNEPTDGLRASALTFDGARIHVAGTMGGQGLSVSFAEAVPTVEPRELPATPLLVPAMRAFHGVAAHPAGGVYLAGIAPDGALRVVRVTSANVVDTTWGNAGYAEVPRAPGDSAMAAGIAVDSVGRIVVAYSFTTGGAMRVARMSADGAPDPAFGARGVDLPLLTLSRERIDVGIDLDDEILIPGLVPVSDGAPIRGGFVRIHANGTLDRNYGDAGIVAEPIPDGDAGRPRPDRALLALSPDARRCQGTAFLYVMDGVTPRIHAYTP